MDGEGEKETVSAAGFFVTKINVSSGIKIDDNLYLSDARGDIIT